MAAYTASKVSISNGDKAVVIDSNESPENVSKGDFLYISGSDPKEINRTYVNDNQKHVIELVLNWDSGNKTNQPAIVIPTTVNFRATVDAIQNANLLINDNMQAMSDWQSKLGTVTFLGLDGVERTVDTLSEVILKSNVATEQTLEAKNEILGLSAETSTQYPMLSVPFIDGTNIEHGYGTKDKLDISAAQDGSLVTELPTKSVDFSRSSMAWNVNNKGEIEELPLNTPVMTRDGIFLHGEYTNYHKNNTNLHLLSTTNLSATEASEVGPTGEQCTELKEAVGSGEHFIDILNVICNEGQDYNYSIFVKPKEGTGLRNILLRTHSGLALTSRFMVSEDGEVTPHDPANGTVSAYGNGWYQISFKLKATKTANIGFRCQLLNGSSTVYEGEDLPSILIAGPQITDTEGVMPLLLTEGTAVTAPATYCSVPIANNMPRLGESFTIVFDAAVPNKKSVVLSIKDVRFVFWRFAEGGLFSFRIGDSSNVINVSLSIDLEASLLKARYTLVWDKAESEFRGYADGVKQDSVPVVDFNWSESPLGSGSPNLNIGHGVQSAFLNSSIRGLKILGYAASDNEVASWGAPK